MQDRVYGTRERVASRGHRWSKHLTNAVLEDGRLTLAERMFLSWVIVNADHKTGVFQQTARQICEALHTGSPGHVCVWLKKLCELGYLEMLSKGNPKSTKPSSYRVLCITQADTQPAAPKQSAERKDNTKAKKPADVKVLSPFAIKIADSVLAEALGEGLTVSRDRLLSAIPKIQDVTSLIESSGVGGICAASTAITNAIAVVRNSKSKIKHPEAYLVGVIGKKLREDQTWAANQ